MLQDTPSFAHDTATRTVSQPSAIMNIQYHSQVKSMLGP
jgi:hypothetical protein